MPNLNLVFTSDPLLVDGKSVSRVLRNAVVESGVLYLCEETSNRLSIWAVSSPSVPSRIVKLSDLSITSPLDIKKNGDHVYVTGGAAKCVYSIDVSDTSNPVLDDTLTDTVNLNLPHGSYFYDNLLYVCCFGGNGLTIVDCSTPTSLSVKGTLFAASLTGAHDVVVPYPYAYVASHYGTVGGAYDGEITCINVTDPTLPTVESVCTEKAQYAHIVKKGNSLFVGGALSGGSYLYSFGISTPTTITYTSRVASGYGYWIALTGDYAVTVDGTDLIHIIDVSDTSSMTISNNYSEANLTDIRNVCILNNYVYVAARDSTKGPLFKIYYLRIPPSAGGGNWEQLLTISKENKRIKEEEKTQEKIKCPVCDYILKENSQGKKSCSICGWIGI